MSGQVKTHKVHSTISSHSTDHIFMLYQFDSLSTEKNLYIPFHSPCSAVDKLQATGKEKYCKLVTKKRTDHIISPDYYPFQLTGSFQAKIWKRFYFFPRPVRKSTAFGSLYFSTISLSPIWFTLLIGHETGPALNDLCYHLARLVKICGPS